jgi:hypothetical protein
MSQFPVLIIRDFAELADALAAMKTFRGLSNEALEELTGLTKGAVDKMLGPQRAKGIGKNSLPWLLTALAGRLVLIRDFQQEQIMRSRWEGRNHAQVRVNANVVSKDFLARAAPVLFRRHTRAATLARLTKIPPEKRSKIARRAAKMRWKRQLDRQGTHGVQHKVREEIR